MDYTEPNARATSFKGGVPGQGLKMHFLTKVGEDKTMVRCAGQSFFLTWSELQSLVLKIEEHQDFLKTHNKPQPPKDYSDADEDAVVDVMDSVFATDSEIPF